VPKQKKPVDAAAWARSTSRRIGGLVCTLCAAPDARAALETIGEMKRSGETTASIRQIREFIKDSFGIEIGETAISRHLRDHRK